ncbi:MAG: thiamine pyrophosphate-binding protein [Burkholderiaceae bacterium]|nr:thiamine pyrophosphate-binding protein [Burkholderiaceae bacterium]
MHSGDGAAAQNGAEALIRMLQAYGVRHLFGVCGDTSLPYYDALHRLEHGITHVLARDERSAAYMADAYARVSARVGVCEGPSGGGATYLLPGLVEANESSVPVLGFTSDVAVTSRGRYPLTELDQQALYAPLTKWNGTFQSAATIGDQVRAAFRAMSTGRPGSAHLCVPYDVQKQPVSPETLWAQPEHGGWPSWRSAPDESQVTRAAQCLLEARQPVFVCGGGVIAAGAFDEIARLALLLDAPVCTTVSGKGAVSDAFELSAGVVGSNGGVPATRDVIAAADAVVFVGCRAGSTSTEHWRYPRPGTTVIHIDVDAFAISTSYLTEAALVGDARLALAALIARIEPERGSSPPGADPASPGRKLADAARRVKASGFAALAASDERPIKPERIVATLRRVLADDAIVCADPGTPCPYFAAYFELPRPGRWFITNRAHGALGFSLPAALGAWFARPASRCVAVMGDGSFGFVAGELETVLRYDAPLLLVVLSNASFGWIKASQRASYGKRYFSVDFRATDHAQIARAYGMASWRVEDPTQLEPALRAALAHGGPALVDIVTQPLELAAAPVSQWMG